MKSLIPFLLFFALGCNQNAKSSDGDCGEPPPPPPPPLYDHYEEEPNDELDFPQFLEVLPLFDEQSLLGSFLPPLDTDCYGFFLDPSLGATAVWFNFMIKSHPDINPKVKLWQTTYDAQGFPTGYQLLGTWVAADGLLIVVDEEIPFDEFYNNDMIMEIIPWGGLGDPQVDLTYELDFWSS